MELTERLKNSLYVDDLVTGEANNNKVLELYPKSNSIMQRGEFNLRKWNTSLTVVRGNQPINRRSDAPICIRRRKVHHRRR